jgi:hypothetical protein
MSVHAFAVPGGVCPTAACAAPGGECLQEPVQALYMSLAPVCVLLCCSWTCLSTKAFVQLLGMSVYSYSFCAAVRRDEYADFLSKRAEHAQKNLYAC